MTDIEFLENNLNALQHQLDNLKDIKVKQLNVLHDLEQLEQKYEKQLAALHQYITQAEAPQEFEVIEPFVEKPVAVATPVIEAKIEEKSVADFVEILPEEPKIITAQKLELEEPKPAKTVEENLNEKLAKVRKESTVEMLNHTKIEDIRKAINLNQSMAFAKTFFHGDNSQFSIFMDALNTCGSLDAAKTIIQSQLDANRNEELYNNLVHLAERRWH